MITTIFTPKQILALKILGGLTVVVLVIVTIMSIRAKTPVVSTTNPESNTQNYPIFNPLTYTFKDPIVVSELQFSLSPETPFDISQTKENVITLAPKRPLQPSTQYTTTTTWNNKTIYTLVFVTQSSQTDPILIENMKTELARDYPLGQKLPLNRPGFRVVYSAPMTLEIALKNQTASSSEVIEEVKSWVTQNGGDATAHKYVIAPSTSLKP